MYIFKYHPDNTIYVNGTYNSKFSEFMAENPDFPLIENQFFEYSNNKFSIINSEGHHILADESEYSLLINAINDYVNQ